MLSQIMNTIFKCTHTEGKGHDCQFVEAVNKHIPKAEKKADKEAKTEKEWNKIFHSEMAKLTEHFRTFVGIK